MDKVQAVQTYLFQRLLTNPIDPQIAFFFDSTDPSKLKRVRSLLPFGGPLKGFTSRNDRRTEQVKLYDAFAKVWEPKMWEQFGLELTFFRSAYRNEAVHGPLRAWYFSETLNNLEFSRVVSTDLMWTLLAMALCSATLHFTPGVFF